MAPASMLALTESHLNVPGEYKFAMTVVRSNQYLSIVHVRKYIPVTIYNDTGFGTWRVWNHPTSTKKVRRIYV